MFRLILMFICTCAFAQQSQRPPKIALVLEGGSALGLAHIGVLEWMEENRIPIHLITGASMGALIGGLYASGMSTKEIRSLVESIDWDQTLSGKVPYKSMAFRRKEDRVAFPNRLELGLRHGVQFPGGFNSGHFISMIFSRAALPYPDLRSFDDLPIPFRCVATEMVSGKEAVFDHGPLGDALRATMSLPAIFLPAVKDGKVYTDGATLDNLPTGVARNLGADIVIGVHLAPGPVDEKQLRTITGLLSRTVRLVVSDNELRSMQLADIMIMADLKGILASDYSRWEEIAEIGHKAAEQKKNILSRFALEDADWKNHLAQRASRRKTAPQQAAFVDVEGTSQPLEDSIERRLQGFVNRPFLPSAFERELTYAVGLGRYDSLSYRFIRKNGQTGLLVQAREKVHGPPFLLPAVEIDGKDQGNVGFLFLSRLTMLDLGGYRSELRTDLTFGSRYGIATEYYRPLTTKSPVFVALRASAQKSKVEIYQFKERVAEYGLLDYGGGLDIGVTFSRFAEWRTGYTYSAIDAQRRIGSSLLPNGGERTDNVSTRFAYEGQDDPVVAMHGVRLATALRYYPLGNNFWQGDFRVNAATGISPKASFIYGAAGGSSFGQSDVGLRFFSLGGPVRLGAYGPNELIGSAYFIGTAGYVREISTLPALAGDKIYVAGLLQGAKIEGPQSYTGVAMSGTGLIVAKTLLGPVFVGGSWGDRGHRRWFFGLGRVF